MSRENVLKHTCACIVCNAKKHEKIIHIMKIHFHAVVTYIRLVSKVETKRIAHSRNVKNARCQQRMDWLSVWYHLDKYIYISVHSARHGNSRSLSSLQVHNSRLKYYYLQKKPIKAHTHRPNRLATNSMGGTSDMAKATTPRSHRSRSPLFQVTD